MHTTLRVSLLALACSSALLAQYPQSSTLPRGDVRLNSTLLNNSVIGFGHWRTASPKEVLPAGPAGTVPTANVAYVTWAETNLNGQVVVMFARSTNGGFSWLPAQTLYTVQTGEAIDGAETRLLAMGHQVFLVFASNGHTLVAGQQAVFAMASGDQGQTWTGPTPDDETELEGEN